MKKRKYREAKEPMGCGHARGTLIRDRPKQDRPYERCLEYGASHLTDAELLAVIIRSGTAGMSSVDLANRILQLAPGSLGLAGLCRLTVRELTALPGIGEVKAAELLCAAEISRRIARSPFHRNMRFCDPDIVASYYMENLRHEEQEHVVVAMLDTKNRLLGDVWLTKGTANASLVSLREVFQSAVRMRAVSIILVHNHPSGDPTPSPEDRNLTGKIIRAGILMEIPLLDHIVIGDRRYVSFAKKGYLVTEEDVF